MNIGIIIIFINQEKQNNVDSFELLYKCSDYLHANVEIIKQYFTCSAWSYFNDRIDDEIGLIRTIYKDEGYKLSFSGTLNKQTLTIRYFSLSMIEGDE